MYTKLLKVSTPEGKRIPAIINRTGKKVSIGVNYLKIVERDDPPFAKRGIINISCNLSKYIQTVNLLTQYLEDLFLKGMTDESIYTSLGVKSKSRRTKAKNIERKIGKSERKRGSSSVQSGARRDESSKSSGRRNSDSEMAEGGDSPISRKN